MHVYRSMDATAGVATTEYEIQDVHHKPRNFLRRVPSAMGRSPGSHLLTATASFGTTTHIQIPKIRPAYLQTFSMSREHAARSNEARAKFGNRGGLSP